VPEFSPAPEAEPHPQAGATVVAFPARQARKV
jgi:hypothetical protein